MKLCFLYVVLMVSILVELSLSLLATRALQIDRTCVTNHDDDSGPCMRVYAKFQLHAPYKLQVLIPRVRDYVRRSNVVNGS